jgi:hypothetical protein
LIGFQDAQRDPHRGGLAGAVASDEPDDVPAGHLERDAVERDDATEPSMQVDELEHRSARIGELR